MSAYGTKYSCPECSSKYYDLNKSDAVCPSCGAKPPPPKIQPAARSGRSRSAFGLRQPKAAAPANERGSPVEPVAVESAEPAAKTAF